MRYYFAPMEGITGFVFRNAHHRYFSGVDRYFSPFIAPNQNRSFSPRERRDLLPENNAGVAVVPQILTNRAEDFVKAALELRDMGYNEVNLNLGCPSKTVVTKGRGSGFLADPEKLGRFLAEVFTSLADQDVKISIKTRIGKDSSEEWQELMELYNRFPLEELIVHPRIQQDYYKNTPRMEVFQQAMADSRNRVCYNGDIYTVKDYEKLTSSFLSLEAVMLGRGLIANPWLALDVRGTDLGEDQEAAKMRLRAFHDEIYAGYEKYMSGERDVLFRMKELWFYLSGLFTDSERYLKNIRKSNRAGEYRIVVDALLREQHLIRYLGGGT